MTDTLTRTIPVTMVAESRLPHTDRDEITTPEAVVGLFRPLMANVDREMCLVAALDTKHRVIAVDTVSVGTVEHTFMAPREVFRTAFARGASALVLAHNHPSGESTPSADDRQVTKRLARAGELLGIEVLDHVVIGDTDWTSLARLGVL